MESRKVPRIGDETSAGPCGADTAAAPGKRVAIVQSNYIPWKGYFDLINRVDEFVLFDDVQYTRRDWRNRNRIKTPHGPAWLTIPVATKGRYLSPIKDVTVDDPRWASSHWRTIAAHYGRARCFARYRDRLEHLYASCEERRLSEVNRRFLAAFCEILGIGTRLSWSMDYLNAGDDGLGRTERLVAICRRAGATSYLSGPAARAYLEIDLFARAGIHVEFADYSGYPEYDQCHPPFVHEVSVLDLILNMGEDSPRYMRSFGW